MRLLIDQNLPSDTASLLRTLGHDAVNARDLSMNRDEDEELLAVAISDKRVIATLDSDFHALIVTQGLSEPSTIFIRVHAPPGNVACEMIHNICNRFEQRLLAGCLITVTEEAVRIRSLPLTDR